MAEVLRVVGGIAGLGGLSLGVLLLVYRDLARDLIRQRAFQTLTAAQASVILGSAVALTFVVATLGIFAGIAAGEGAQPFIVLVAVLLLFLLAALFLLTRRTVGQADPDRGPPRDALLEVGRLIDAHQLDQAERALAGAPGALRSSSGFWHAKSRIALGHNNIPGALAYVEQGLTQAPAEQLLVALKIKILLISGTRTHQTQARSLARASRGLGPSLDEWLTCLTAEGLLAPGVRSATEIDLRCPFPTSTIDTGRP